MKRHRARTPAAAEFFIDNGYVAYLSHGGSPDEVLKWLWQLISQPCDRQSIIVRLALAQCEIRDEAVDGIDGFSYHIISSEPEILIARLRLDEIDKSLTTVYMPYMPMTEFLDHHSEFSSGELLKTISNPNNYDNEPFIDDDGYIGSFSSRTIRDGATIELALPAPTQRTYGCKICGKRYSAHKEWQMHQCMGVPRVISRVNRNGHFPDGEIAVDFRSKTLISDRRRPLDATCG